jgi:hypothetical protein
MKKYIGFETLANFTYTSEWEVYLGQFTEFVDYIDNTLVFSSSENVQEVLVRLQELVLVDIHEMIGFTNHSPTPLCYDYGSYIEKKDLWLLPIDQITIFRVESGEPIQIEMAILEMNEHFLFNSPQDYYVVENIQQELIWGISRAYDIKLSLLNLDNL